MTLLDHLSLTEVSLSPGAEWAHVLPGWCFMQLTSGDAYWLNKKSTHELASGDMVVIPGKNCGSLRVSQLGPASLTFFCLCPDLLAGVLSLRDRHALDFQTRQSLQSLRFFKAAEDPARHFTAVRSSEEGHPLSRRIQMLQLLAHCLPHSADSFSTSPPTELSIRDRFQQLIQQMPEADIIHHSIDDLARRCHCSPRHFSRLFHRQFGVPLRSKQTQLRMEKAKQLLSNTDSKIINVALESGYRHLGLFNSMFKKYLGTTPSQWRRDNLVRTSGKKSGRLSLALFFLISTLSVARAQTSSASAPARTNSVATFEIKGYQVDGNTVLPSSDINKILGSYTGKEVTFDVIKQALSELQLAYRGRGFATVLVSLPQQQLTNGVVRILVTEGRLAEILVVDNHHFSSNNILAALPSVRTNILLNSLVFQQDLDRANASRDRQIYPEIGPGPEPGTTTLRLRVKDRVPIHGRFELNNQATPGSPDLRMNLAAQYNNLWQLNHQVGVQYTFTPEEYKSEDQLPWRFFDQPLIASYSAFYRLPLSSHDSSSAPPAVNLAEFGYDEVTKRFRPPPPTESSELIVYVSRSDADTAPQLQSETLTPSVLPPSGGLQVSDRVKNQTLSVNENIGFRFQKPLPPVSGLHSSLSFGADFKNYRSSSLQTRTFQASFFVPEIGTNGPPFIEFPSPPTASARRIATAVHYLPISLNWDGSWTDPFGSTSFFVNNSIALSGMISSESDYANAAGSPRASGTFYVLNAGLSREQKIFEEWSVSLRAAGQFATEPLINNEQFGLGGLAGPRGYREGEEYGDTGWKVTAEPHTPLLDIGLVDGVAPMRVRASVFTDYGERYLLDPGSRKRSLALWGAGLGLAGTIGETIDFRIAIAWPLLTTASISRRSPHIYFGVGAQF